MPVRKATKGKTGTKAKKTTKKKGKGCKKETRRDRISLNGLEKRFFSRIKQEFFDVDYVNKLSDEEKRYLNDFLNEWLGANTTKAKFHKSKKDRKKVYDANNARNRDIYSNQRATGRFVDYEKIRKQIDEVHGSDNPEDDLIDYIDSKKAIKN